MLKGESLSRIIAEKQKYMQLYLNEVKRFNVRTYLLRAGTTRIVGRQRDY